MSATLTAGIASLVLNINTPLESDGVSPRDDLIGVKVWISTVAVFTPPSQGTLVFDGKDLSVTIPNLNIGTTYYIKYALISDIDPTDYVVSASYSAIPLASTYIVDTTPPPSPIGVTLTPAISSIMVQHDAPVYTVGHGHKRTHVFGVKYISGALPVFADSVNIEQFTGTIGNISSDPAITWRIWLKWESVDGVLSVTPAGGTNGYAVTTGQDVSNLLTAISGKVTTSELSTDLNTRINLIDGSASVVGSVANQVQAEAQARAEGISLIEYQRAKQTTDAAEALLNNVITTYNNDIKATTNLDSTKRYLDSKIEANEYLRVKQATEDAEALLNNVVTTYKNDLTAKGNLAIAKQYLDSKIDDGLLAEATSRLILAAKLDTDIATTLAAVSSEASTRATADSAEATSRLILAAKLDTDIASTLATITNESNTRATADQAEAASRLVLAAKLDTDIASTLAAVVTESNARATADQAEATSRLALAAKLDTDIASTLAAVYTEATARATADQAEATSRLALAAKLDTDIASTLAAVVTESNARATADSAEATSRLTLEAVVSNNNSVVTSRVDTIEQSKIGYCSIGGSASDHSNRTTCEAAGGTWSVGLPLASAVKTVTVTGPTGASATIQDATSAQAALNTGLKAQKVIKLDVNGHVSGYGAYADASGSSEFIANVSRFAVTTPSDVIDTRTTSTSYALSAITKVLSYDSFTLVCKQAGTTSSSALSLSSSAVGDIIQDGTCVWQVASRVPFSVLTAPTSINGLTVPAGIYMDAAYILNGTVKTAQIGNAAVDNSKIANLAVGTANIANAAITNAKIGSLAVGTANISDASITNAKIGALAVDSANINTAAITSAKIGSLQVDTIHVMDNAITRSVTASLGVQVTSGSGATEWLSTSITLPSSGVITTTGFISFTGDIYSFLAAPTAANLTAWLQIGSTTYPVSTAVEYVGSNGYAQSSGFVVTYATKPVSAGTYVVKLFIDPYYVSYVSGTGNIRTYSSTLDVKATYK